MLRSVLFCTFVISVLTGCAPPAPLADGISIDFTAPASETPTIALDADGTLRMWIVVDIEGITYAPEKKGNDDQGELEGHYHLVLGEAPDGIPKQDVPDEVFFEFTRESFPPGTYTLTASLHENNHEPYLDETGQPIATILEFDVTAFEE